MTLATAWHLGALHPAEQALTLLLAFGPFVLLGIVIVVRRRQDRAESPTRHEVRDGSTDQRDR